MRLAIPCPRVRPINPVSHFRHSIKNEARDRADQVFVTGHRAKRDVGHIHHLRHVSVEGSPIMGVFGCECCHLDRYRIAHLLEYGVKIRIADWPENYFCHDPPF